MFAKPLDSEILHYADCNRQTLLASLPLNSAVLVHSGEEQIRNRDVDFPFRASSDFFYLTGFMEPESVCLLVKKQHESSGSVQDYCLFVREKDPEKEVWEGRRLGVENVEEIGASQGFAIDELEEQLADLINGCESIYFSFAELSMWSSLLEPIIHAAKSKSRQGFQPAGQLVDLDGLLHEQRLIKQPIEIEWMRKAAKISVQGHLAAMQSVAVGKTERQIQGALENGFFQTGAERIAFNSIVAGGENACILHYTENNQPLENDCLVLVDAGAEYNFYAGDITTTFPVNGRFTAHQAQIYSLVLKAQQAVIEMIKPGLQYDQLHQKTLHILTQGLIDLQILQGDLDSLIKKEAYKPYFMHGTGHYLGMDVHDVGTYKQQGQWRVLQPGMVITVEPGLYLSAGIAGLDPKWHSIGIRIEDDVLVTENGYEVLTTGLPRSVAEIEQFMHQRTG